MPKGKNGGGGGAVQNLPLVCAPATIGTAAAGAVGMWGGLLKLSLFFLKVGATLFGSGYILVSYLRGGLVDDYGWLSSRELTDAIAVGQITPGPLLTTATFVGYILGHRWGGFPGAIAAGVISTIAIFLPSFFLTGLLGPMFSRLRTSRLARGALDGMNAAVVALILVVTVSLARDALSGLSAGIIAAASLLVMLLWNLNTTWLIVGAGLAGWLVWRTTM